MGKIPYIKRNTQFYYLSDPIDTGKILGLSNKDEYGYYDEIFIEEYDQKLKRYLKDNLYKYLINIKNIQKFIKWKNEYVQHQINYLSTTWDAMII